MAQPPKLEPLNPPKWALLISTRGDGTSQSRRTAQALDPDRFPVDERALLDFLAFARKQGETLVYYGPDDKAAGTFSAFIDPALSLEKVVAFLKKPDDFTPETSPELFRPHFTLFLAFMQLLESARGELNTLTGRHLDFYYKELLKMTGKGPVPDRVNVIFELAAGSSQAEVPAESLLSAGPDRLGRERLYSTDREILVNRSQIAQKSSVFVERSSDSSNGDPNTERWLGLSAWPDATDAKASSDGVNLGWKTFGAPLVHPPPTLGWAVRSPVLALAGGKRTITLKLTLSSVKNDLTWSKNLVDHFPLGFQVSTGCGWNKVPLKDSLQDQPAYATVALAWAPISTSIAATDQQGTQATIVCTLTFDARFPPIAPISAEPGGIASRQPALRLMLQAPEGDAPNYGELRSLDLVKASVGIHVEGLQSITLQNDDGTLDATKPFEPFGSAPSVGSRLLLGHPELVTKKLDTLSFRIEWTGIPDNLGVYYKHYPEADGKEFTVNVCLVQQHVETAPIKNPKAFSKTPPQFDPLGPFEPVSSSSFGRDLRTWERYFVWELNAPDFQQRSYSAVAATMAIKLADAIAAHKTINPDDYVVNLPYTPKIKRLTADYTASQAVAFESSGDDADAARSFHVHPFGYSEINLETMPSVHLVPEYDNEGELYIGLRDTNPPETLSLLVQMVEGRPDPDHDAQPVDYGYLDGDEWKSLSAGGGVLLDTTRGLTQSGILQLKLDRVDKPITRLPGDFYWIRAAVKRGTDTLCDTIALHTQVVSATFADHDNAPDHYDHPLPKDSITKLAPPIPVIAHVRQPYTSTGGRAAEAGSMFNTRVSERLRHKQRALSMWDYERLVLERFPQIYKAKCLPARPDAPGKVTIIVIPNVSNLSPSNPYEPKAPTGLLAAICEYLKTKVPAPARDTLEVRNARYVQIRVNVWLSFASAGNEPYLKQQAAESVKQFLSPWAYDARADITIGGSIYANSIVNFLEHLSYVDYVTDIELFSSTDGGDNFHMVPKPKTSLDGYRVAAELPDGVLTTAQVQRILLKGEKAEEP